MTRIFGALRPSTLAMLIAELRQNGNYLDAATALQVLRTNVGAEEANKMVEEAAKEIRR